MSFKGSKETSTFVYRNELMGGGEEEGGGKGGW